MRGHKIRQSPGRRALDGHTPDGNLAKTEIFGPVFSLTHVETIDEAIKLVNSGEYRNMACLFTSSGSAARKFRYEAQAGNIGINIGVAAPMAFFPFIGWKESFFGTLHGQGKHAVEFFNVGRSILKALDTVGRHHPNCRLPGARIGSTARPRLPFGEPLGCYAIHPG